MRNLLLVAVLVSTIVFLIPPHASTPAPAAQPSAAAPAEVERMMQRQPGCFVPNFGQWDHRAKFVHRNGPMTVFLEDRGWVLDVAERLVSPPVTGNRSIPGERKANQMVRGVAVRMTFEGDSRVPEIVGEKILPGHRNYFLGNDASRWRTEVPLYESVRYRGLYPGIDVRMRLQDGHPEYDLLCEAHADLSAVSVKVEGADGLAVDEDGSLVIDTGLGPITQPKPSTWERLADGGRRPVDCEYVVLGGDRFGFVVADWDGAKPLVIDPGLLWSTFLGGIGRDGTSGISVDANGVVTVAGLTTSFNFPMTGGVYDTTSNGNYDVYVSRLIPAPIGRAALLYSTYLGGSNRDFVTGMSVDSSGVVTVGGGTFSSDFPTTRGAFDTIFGATYKGFVSRLDPSKTGSAQLVYSTFLGGSRGAGISALSADAGGVITVTGETVSSDHPTTSGAYDTIYNTTYPGDGDGFVSRLDPSKTGAAQLVYSTYLGGIVIDRMSAISVDAAGVVTVAGWTQSYDYPTTSGAYDRNHGGGYWDAFVSRLDPRKTGIAQLVYSTYLGGTSTNQPWAVSADASGVVTVAGRTFSTDFPTTQGAFDSTYNGGRTDAFVSRLDPRKTGTAQLVYSTFLGGQYEESAQAMAVDSDGVVTVVGSTDSSRYPVTPGAHDTTHNGPNNYGGDAFVSRLDPRKTGTAQLVYSTFLGSTSYDRAGAVVVDGSGVAIVAGNTNSVNFPTTNRTYDATYNSGTDAFISRLSMGVPLYGSTHQIPIRFGGWQGLTVNAGKAHANRLYWIFGSVTGTTPGINLLGMHIPLNADLYTDVAIANVNSAVFTRFKGTLDANGLASARFNVPANLPVASGFTFHHAYVVYDASGKLYLASNAVPLRLK